MKRRWDAVPATEADGEPVEFDIEALTLTWIDHVPLDLRRAAARWWVSTVPAELAATGDERTLADIVDALASSTTDPLWIAFAAAFTAISAEAWAELDPLVKLPRPWAR